MQVHVITSDVTKVKREKILSEIYRSKRTSAANIIISTYQLVSNMIDSFAFTAHESENGSFIYDYVILDEGHIIKNPSTKLYKAMHL